jgi:hypothetical protein
MRRPWLIVYSGLMLATTVAAIAFAVLSWQRAQAGRHWKSDETAWARRYEAAHHSDLVAVARFNAAKAASDRLTRQVNESNQALARAIAATQKLKRKIITGSTIVSYVTVPTKAG